MQWCSRYICCYNNTPVVHFTLLGCCISASSGQGIKTTPTQIFLPGTPLIQTSHQQLFALPRLFQFRQLLRGISQLKAIHYHHERSHQLKRCVFTRVSENLLGNTLYHQTPVLTRSCVQLGKLVAKLRILAGRWALYYEHCSNCCRTRLLLDFLPNGMAKL